ncbi:MAG: glycosyltransferase [Deltaproteobacteria bacterium]|nr:glycosyltransferase [Deltaproteobacteria bacterium]
MIVLDITSFFSSGCGGIKRYLIEKSRLLPSENVEYHIIVPGEFDRTSSIGDGTLHEIAGPLTPRNDEYRMFGSSAKLVDLILKLRPDVIELGSHYWLPTIVNRAVRRLPYRPRVVGFFHSHPRQVVEPVVRFLPTRIVGDVLAEIVWKFLCRRHAGYDATLVASRTIEVQLARRGVPNVTRVGLGVDVNVFSPDAAPEKRAAAHPGASKPLLLTYAGRFTADKELDVLMRAFPIIHARTGATLRCIGSGPWQKRLERFAAEQAGVSVMTYVNAPSDMARCLAESDVVVVPSQTETFSLVTAETLASGTPVLGPNRGGVRELIEDSHGGMLFKAGSSDSMAETFERLAAMSPANRLAISDAGRKHAVDHLTWERVTRRALDVYTAALEVPERLLEVPDVA